MKSLFDYPELVNGTFYRCWSVLDYIKAHPNLNILEQKIIKATIMDALVYSGAIDAENEALDLEHLCIVQSQDSKYYHYEEFPDVMGIPKWMMERLSKKCLVITGGIPVSLSLAKPPSKIMQYCVYDPNTAVSSIFEDFTFYEARYISPTRGILIESTRPFVEVSINGTNYLVDTILNIMYRSDYFKEQYQFEAVKTFHKKDFTKKQAEIYEEHVSKIVSLANIIPFFELNASLDPLPPYLKQMVYELELSKQNFPEEWEKSEQLKAEMESFVKVNDFLYKRTLKED